MGEKEIWKDVTGYEGYYQVSSLGRVKSLPRHRKVGWADYLSKEKILKQCDHRQGYKLVLLYKDGKTRMYKVHQLVAMAFIPNPKNYKCVNHKDENKANNKVDNLEFCDHSYNNNYGTRNEKVMKANCRIINQYTLDGEFVKEWYGARDAGRTLGIKHQCIFAACKGERKTAGGYIWKFKK